MYEKCDVDGPARTNRTWQECRPTSELVLQACIHNHNLMSAVHHFMQRCNLARVTAPSPASATGWVVLSQHHVIDLLYSLLYTQSERQDGSRHAVDGITGVWPGNSALQTEGYWSQDAAAATAVSAAVSADSRLVTALRTDLHRLCTT